MNTSVCIVYIALNRWLYNLNYSMKLFCIEIGIAVYLRISTRVVIDITIKYYIKLSL